MESPACHRIRCSRPARRSVWRKQQVIHHADYPEPARRHLANGVLSVHNGKFARRQRHHRPRIAYRRGIANS